MDEAATTGLLLGRFAAATSYAVRRPAGAGSWLLLVTESGRGRATWADRDLDLERGTAALLPAGVAHAYGTAPGAEGWGFWWAHFQVGPSWARLLPPGTDRHGLGVTGLAEPVVADLLEGFARLHAAARWPGTGPVPHPVGDPDVALAAADRAWPLAAPQLESLLVLLTASTAPAAVDDRVRRALDLVAADPARVVTLPELAAAVALSSSRLSHLAAAELGRPLMAEVRRLRLEHAARLLVGTTLPVARVATASGFASPFHFSRAFRSAYGVSPTTYRSAGPIT